MAKGDCNISNRGKYAEVVADNGKPSLLFEAVSKLPFVQPGESALDYYVFGKELASKEQDILKDENNEPIMVFMPMSDGSSIIASRGTVVYESFEEAFKADTDRKGVKVGFVRTKNRVTSLYENTSEASLRTKHSLVVEGTQADTVTLGFKDTQQHVMMMDDQFIEAGQLKTSGVSRSFEGFVTEMMIRGIVDMERSRDPLTLQEPGLEDTLPGFREMTLAEMWDKLTPRQTTKLLRASEVYSDAGYHGGTLGGRSDFLQPTYRGDQPYTGYYFYSDPERALMRGDRSRSDSNEFAVVDFSKYNLLKPSTNQYWILKGDLKRIEEMMTQGRTMEEALARREDNLGWWMPSLYQLMVANSDKLQEAWDQWIKEKEEAFAKPRNQFRGVERFETRMLKTLGYEGVDVRGLKDERGDASPDNSSEGSVIFELKPNTVQKFTKAKIDSILRKSRIQLLSEALGGTEKVNLTGVKKTPKVANEALIEVKDNYIQDKGLPQREPVYTYVDQELFDEMADFYVSAKDDRQDPEMLESYEAFFQETKAQFDALTEAGFELVPWMDKGEPYGVESKLVRKDLRENNRLYYLRTVSELGDNDGTNTAENYYPLRPAGFDINGEPVVLNDLFRAVHDTFGHGMVVNSFSTQGEFDAYKTHSVMYSPKAQKALFAETVMLNAYYNKFKKYAPRKIYNVPDGFIERVNSAEDMVDYTPLAENKSQDTQEFFSKVVKGGDEKFEPSKPWSPLLEFSEAEQEFKEEYTKFTGNFDRHISTSIPTHRDTQIKVGQAILEMNRDKQDSLVYDIGGSEGGFVKAITSLSNGSIRSINLDVNTDMKNAHETNPVANSEFVQETFYEGFEGIPRHRPKEKADVVHESMVFQFISPERKQFVSEVKNNYLKDDGILLLEEKLLPDTEEEWRRNEEKKNEYKLQYYTADQINQKSEEILVGMKKNQTKESDLITILEGNFEFVAPYWDAGNFKGYIATNSQKNFREFLDKIGGTITSQYSAPLAPKVASGLDAQSIRGEGIYQIENTYSRLVFKDHVNPITGEVFGVELNLVETDLEGRYSGSARRMVEKFLAEAERLKIPVYLTIAPRKTEPIVPTKSVDGRITPASSSNFANLTQDGEGNFVFYHVGKKGYKDIKPGTGQNRATSSSESSAIGKVGGLAMYYTRPRDAESMVSRDAKYMIKVPRDKVYDFNADPLNFIKEAKELHAKEHPGLAFDTNTQLAYVTKVANSKGFDMVVSEWDGRTRAQTTQQLKPVDTQEYNGNTVTKMFKEDYQSNTEKGWKSIPAVVARDNMESVYDAISNVFDKKQDYGNPLYSLSQMTYYDFGDPYAPFSSQAEITEAIESSKLPKRMKDRYYKALEKNTHSGYSTHNKLETTQAGLRAFYESVGFVMDESFGYESDFEMVKRPNVRPLRQNNMKEVIQKFLDNGDVTRSCKL